jgi:hypothetical protein
MIRDSLLKKVKMKAPYMTAQNSYEIDICYLLMSTTLIALGAGVPSIDGILGL